MHPTDIQRTVLTMATITQTEWKPEATVPLDGALQGLHARYVATVDDKLHAQLRAPHVGGVTVYFTHLERPAYACAEAARFAAIAWDYIGDLASTGEPCDLEVHLECISNGEVLLIGDDALALVHATFAP